MLLCLHKIRGFLYQDKTYIWIKKTNNFSLTKNNITARSIKKMKEALADFYLICCSPYKVLAGKTNLVVKRKISTLSDRQNRQN